MMAEELTPKAEMERFRAEASAVLAQSATFRRPRGDRVVGVSAEERGWGAGGE